MSGAKEARIRFEEGSFFDWYVRFMKEAPDADERNHGELASRVCRLGAKSEVLEVLNVQAKPADAISIPPAGQIGWHLTTTGPDVRPVVRKIHEAFSSARTSMLRSDPPGHVVEARGTIEGWDVGSRAGGERILHAIDGTEIRVEHQGARRHEPECWRARWANPDGGVDITKTWDHEPTSEDVLAAYEKWRQSKARTVVAWDWTRIEVLSNGCGWVIRWPGETRLRTNCPTDAEVLAYYEAWRKAQSKPEREIDRSIIAPDSMAIKVSQGVVDLTEQRSRPTDADVLVEYGKRRRYQERAALEVEVKHAELAVSAAKRALDEAETKARKLRAKINVANPAKPMSTDEAAQIFGSRAPGFTVHGDDVKRCDFDPCAPERRAEEDRAYDAAQPVVTAKAPDGFKLVAKHTLGRNGVWTVYNDKHCIATYLSLPTAEQLLTDYEKYRSWSQPKPRREIVAPDLWHIIIRPETSGCSWTIDGATWIPCAVNSDEAVLAAYAERKKQRDAIKRELADLEKRAAELRGKL